MSYRNALEWADIMDLWKLKNKVFGQAQSDGVVVVCSKTGYSIAFRVQKGVFLLPLQKGMDWSGGEALFFKAYKIEQAREGTLEPEDAETSESPVNYNLPPKENVPEKFKARDSLEAPANYNPDPFPHKKNSDSRPGVGFTFVGPADGAMPEAEKKKEQKKNHYDFDEGYPASWPVTNEDDPYARKPPKKDISQTKYGYGPRSHQTGDE